MPQHTQEQMRELFMEHMIGVAKYWAKVAKEKPEEYGDPEQLAMAMLHSFLCVFDGVSGAMPAFEIIASPHESDKEFNEGNGANWWAPFPEEVAAREDVITIHGNCLLHELVYKRD